MVNALLYVAGIVQMPQEDRASVLLSKPVIPMLVVLQLANAGLARVDTMLVDISLTVLRLWSMGGGPISCPPYAAHMLVDQLPSTLRCGCRQWDVAALTN